METTTPPLPQLGVKEIEAAIDRLSPGDQATLFALLSRKQREAAGVPEPRVYSREQIEAWVAEDEADMRSFREGK